jgi:hypothetical protein
VLCESWEFVCLCSFVCYVSLGDLFVYVFICVLCDSKWFVYCVTVVGLCFICLFVLCVTAR